MSDYWLDASRLVLYVTARKLQEEDAASFFVLMTCQCPFNLPSRFVQLASLTLIFFFLLFVLSEKGRVLIISDVFIYYDYFINASTVPDRGVVKKLPSFEPRSFRGSFLLQ